MKECRIFERILEKFHKGNTGSRGKSQKPSWKKSKEIYWKMSRKNQWRKPGSIYERNLGEFSRSFGGNPGRNLSRNPGRNPNRNPGRNLLEGFFEEFTREFNKWIPGRIHERFSGGMHLESLAEYLQGSKEEFWAKSGKNTRNPLFCL